jgi:hippurate hydrolase
MTDEFHAPLTSWRRHLHAHPGLTLEEGPTAAFVVQKLREMGITDIAENIGGHGVVATIRRGGGNRSVGLRGDMDALPIEEQADDLPWRSTVPGVMHIQPRCWARRGCCWTIRAGPVRCIWCFSRRKKAAVVRGP